MPNEAQIRLCDECGHLHKCIIKLGDSATPQVTWQCHYCQIGAYSADPFGDYRSEEPG